RGGFRPGAAAENARIGPVYQKRGDNGFKVMMTWRSGWGFCDIIAWKDTDTSLGNKEKGEILCKGNRF
ncbi:MAG TPA: hypothetical protein PLZ22_03910, partial [Thermotogota bacterium]|nr:hypothetical protein [Thermotogota bacterium]